MQFRDTRAFMSLSPARQDAIFSCLSVWISRERHNLGRGVTTPAETPVISLSPSTSGCTTHSLNTGLTLVMTNVSFIMSLQHTSFYSSKAFLSFCASSVWFVFLILSFVGCCLGMGMLIRTEMKDDPSISCLCPGMLHFWKNVKIPLSGSSSRMC